MYMYTQASNRLKRTLLEAGNGRVVLELVEGALEHVLGIDLLHAQQVEHHVVGEVERTVEGVG